MSETAYLITAITTLAGVIVTLWIQNGKLHNKYVDLIKDNNKQYTDMLKDNTEKMTTALTDTSRSSEHLANAIDDLKLVVINRKK